MQRFPATLNKSELKSFIFTLNWHVTRKTPHLPLTQFAHPAWFRYNLGPPTLDYFRCRVARTHLTKTATLLKEKGRCSLWQRNHRQKKEGVVEGGSKRRGEERRDKPNKGLERWRHTVLYQASRVRCVNGMGDIGPITKQWINWFFFSLIVR